MFDNCVILFQVNPVYEETFVFANDFPALLSEGPAPGELILIYHNILPN